MVHSLVLATMDIQEMGSLAKVICSVGADAYFIYIYTLQISMSAALILVTPTPCVLMYLVHSLVLVTVDTLEMDSLVEVKFFSVF